MESAGGSVDASGLRRDLGALDVALITFNSVVGSAIFIAAAIVPRFVTNPVVILALWAIAGLLTLAGAVTYAELGAMYPKAGGPYHYLKEAYGPLWGFLFGWTSFWVIQTGAIAFLAVAAADVLLGLAPAAQAYWAKLLATALIAGFTAVNYVGLRAGARMQNAIAAIKIASLLAFVVFGLAAAPARPGSLLVDEASGPFVLPGPALLGAAMIGTLWCFDGWYQACFCAGEIRDPGRNLLRGMVLGTVAIAVLYLLVNVVYLRALSPSEMAQSPRIAEAAAGVLLGDGAGRLMGIAVGVSILGCLASCILSGARAYLPMAQDGLFFSALARVHPVHRTPGPCLSAQAVWAILLAWTGSYEALGVYVIFAVFVFHAATGAAVFVLRRTQPETSRPYRVWLYPWTPLLFILTSLAFVFSTLWERPVESLWGVGIVLLGIPAFLWWRRSQRYSEPIVTASSGTRTPETVG
jgi:APA family basic amino acid/polyamine antiporter